MELKTRNFVITQDIAKHEVSNKRKNNQLLCSSTLSIIPLRYQCLNYRIWKKIANFQ